MSALSYYVDWFIGRNDGMWFVKQLENKTPDLEALDQASDWLVKFNEGNFSDQDRRAFEHWRQASPANAQAWLKAEALINKLGHLPPALAMPALSRPEDTSRRAFINKFALLLLMAPISWGSWRLLDSQGWIADHKTSRGEQRKIQLADGTQLQLNTDTAIKVSFSSSMRLIHLVKGEVLIDTGQDLDGNRPFKVATAQGRLQALGTRFHVRQFEDHSQLSVLEGAVRIEPHQVPSTHQIVISADEQAEFSEQHIETPAPLTAANTAWTQGMLLADNMPLEEFTRELSRYHQVWFDISGKAAGLRISGSYPITQLEQTLNMLTNTYHIKQHKRLAGYWYSLTTQ